MGRKAGIHPFGASQGKVEGGKMAAALAAEAEWLENDGQRYQYEAEVATREPTPEEAMTLSPLEGAKESLMD
jgi:hypothetical protein